MLVVFYGVAALVAWLWSGGAGDVAALMRAGGDERQRAVDRNATAVARFAMAGVALVSVVVQLARDGDPTPYAVICAAGGLAYTRAVVVLRRR